MDTTAARTLALELMAQYRLDTIGWTFTFDRAKSRAGQCRFDTRVISMSESYVKINNEDEIRDTILHEIAHALCGKAAGHGPVWQRKARAIGCTGKRTTAAKASESHRYEAHCPGNGTAHIAGKYHRRPSIRMLNGGYCNKHRVSIIWIDTTTGVAINGQASTVFVRETKTVKSGNQEKAWVSGSSNWDSMFA